MYYLYVKTHTTTGLRYLGQTRQKDPHSYRGSGVRWLNHLKVHGPHYTTEIIFQSEDRKEIERVGLYFSSLWNVVESDDWANLMEESGAGGALSSESLVKRANTCLVKYGVTSIAQTQSRREAVRDNNKKLHATGKFAHSYFRPDDPRAAKANLPEAIAKRKETFKLIGHQSGEKNSQYGTIWITDGSINKKIRSSDSVPDGWCRGRSKTVAG